MDIGERIGEHPKRAIASTPVRRRVADRVKYTAVTRRLGADVRVSIGPQPEGPRLGRFVVARVLGAAARARAGASARDRSGRPLGLYRDDLIVGAWAHQGDGESRARLLTAGGLIGNDTNDAEEAREVELVGFVTDIAGAPLSTGSIARMPPRPAIPAIGTVAVVGVDGYAEDVAAAVVHGWARTGFTVGAGRVSGEETGTHRWAMADAGAEVIADFLDFGMPSTHAYPSERRAATMLAIRDALVGDGAQIVVLQLDDGARAETRPLLGRLASIADAAVVCAADEQVAQAMLDQLEGLAIPVRVVSGPVADDDASAAAVATWSELPVRSAADLSAGAAASLLGDARPGEVQG